MKLMTKLGLIAAAVALSTLTAGSALAQQKLKWEIGRAHV